MRSLLVLLPLLASTSVARADPSRVADDPNRTLAGFCARGQERLAGGDDAGARALLEEAVRSIGSRTDVSSEVAADCLVGLARVEERAVDRPGHVDEAAALYSRALALRPDAEVRARLALAGTLAPIAGPFPTADAAIAHLQEATCAPGAACRVWATQASSSWPGAQIRDARIVAVSTAAEGSRAFVVVVTAAGAYVMPALAAALVRDGMTGGVGGSVEHRAVLSGGGRQVVVRAAAFRDFAERWEAARPTVQRIAVCDVVDGTPRCTQPFDGPARLELSTPGRVTFRREGARPSLEDSRPFEDLRCAPWLFADGACAVP